MDALLFDVDEFYNQLPANSPDMEAYIQTVEKYENAIEKLQEALPASRMFIAQDIVKVVSEMSMIELKMSFKQGFLAGFAGCERSGQQPKRK